MESRSRRQQIYKPEDFEIGKRYIFRYTKNRDTLCLWSNIIYVNIETDTIQQLPSPYFSCEFSDLVLTDAGFDDYNTLTNRNTIPATIFYSNFYSDSDSFYEIKIPRIPRILYDNMDVFFGDSFNINERKTCIF